MVVSAVATADGRSSAGAVYNGWHRGAQSPSVSCRMLMRDVVGAGAFCRRVPGSNDPPGPALAFDGACLTSLTRSALVGNGQVLGPEPALVTDVSDSLGSVYNWLCIWMFAWP